MDTLAPISEINSVERPLGIIVDQYLGELKRGEDASEVFT
jgi:hypothetical protein